MPSPAEIERLRAEVERARQAAAAEQARHQPGGDVEQRNAVARANEERMRRLTGGRSDVSTHESGATVAVSVGERFLLTVGERFDCNARIRIEGPPLVAVLGYEVVGFSFPTPLRRFVAYIEARRAGTTHVAWHCTPPAALETGLEEPGETTHPHAPAAENTPLFGATTLTVAPARPNATADAAP